MRTISKVPDIDRRHSIINEPVAIFQTTLPRNKPVTSSPASVIVPSFSMDKDDFESPDIDQRHSIVYEPVASSQATLPRNVTSYPAALTSTANDQKLVMLMNERKSKLKEEEPSLESNHVVLLIVVYYIILETILNDQIITQNNLLKNQNNFKTMTTFFGLILARIKFGARQK